MGFDIVEFAGPEPITINGNKQTVLSNATVTGSGSSSVFTGYGQKQIGIIVNVTGAVSGTLTVTLKELDPGNQSTVLSHIDTALISSGGAYTAILFTTLSDTVQVSWTVTGGSPSFAGTYITLVSKNTTVGYGFSAAGSPLAILVDATGAVVMAGEGTAGTPVGGVMTVQGASAGQPLPVTAASLPLPAGAATAANQTTGNTNTGNTATSTASLDTKFPAKGQTTMANSVPVVIPSDQTVPVSAVSLPLPSGAATAAKQDTGNTSLASIDTKTPALGAALKAASTPVNIASDQTVPVSAASLPLPAGAATAASQDTGNTSLATLATNLPAKGAAVTAASTPVNIASDQTVPVSGSVTAAQIVNVSPATQNITALDIASISTTYGTQTFVTGAPTAGSAASFTLASKEGIQLQVTGTWTGQLTLEISVDGGTTWLSVTLAAIGNPPSLVTQSQTNCAGTVQVGGATNFRVRASGGGWTGTATITIVETISEVFDGPFSILIDPSTGNIPAIKGATTAAATGDSSLVVGLSPNSPLPTGNHTIGAVTQGTGNGSPNTAWMMQIAGLASTLADVTADNNLAVTLRDQSLALKAILNMLQRPMWLDPASSQLRVSVENIASALTLSTITTISTVTTVSTVTTLSQLRAFDVKDTLLNSTDRNTWAQIIRGRIA
jgi:hypothetical protein